MSRKRSRKKNKAKKVDGGVTLVNMAAFLDCQDELTEFDIISHDRCPASVYAQQLLNLPVEQCISVGYDKYIDTCPLKRVEFPYGWMMHCLSEWYEMTDIITTMRTSKDPSHQYQVWISAPNLLTCVNHLIDNADKIPTGIPDRKKHQKAFNTWFMRTIKPKFLLHKQTIAEAVTTHQTLADYLRDHMASLYKAPNA